MSQETLAWLNTRTLIGFTAERGTAWHYRKEEQGDQSNHYPGAIPVGDVLTRLFNFEVVEAPEGYLWNGQWIIDPDSKSMVCADTGERLGTFKEGYRGHDYREWLLDGPAKIISASRGELGIGSAGLLKNRAVAWVSIEVPKTITTPEGVPFRPHLVACTSYNGSLATTFKRTVTNVVCDNTLTAGMSEQGQVFKARHSRNSGFKLAAARDALAVVHTIGDDFAAEVKKLTQRTVTRKQFNAWLDAYVPVADVKEGPLKGRSLTMATNKREALVRLYTSDPRCEPWKDTAFGILQAANTFRHHEGIVRGANRAQRNALNAIDGTTETQDAIALDLLDKVLVATAA